MTAASIAKEIGVNLITVDSRLTEFLKGRTFKGKDPQGSLEIKKYTLEGLAEKYNLGKGLAIRIK